MPVQTTGEVLDLKRVGSYFHLRMVAPGIAETAKPGHFVALGVGGDATSLLLRRAFSIYRTEQRSAYGGSVDIVFAVAGEGTRWLSERRRHDKIDIIGPLGRPFALPAEKVSCVLIGGGYGAAPLFTLGEELRSRGCRVDFVLGASTKDRLFGVLEARRMSQALAVTTEDGTEGQRGRVTDVLPGIIEKSDASVLYACGPMGMLQAVAAMAGRYGIHSQCAVEESMACGVGVCMTCVLPVIGDDGRTRMVRSCVEGPVFRGDRVRWADVGTVPADCVGSPEWTASLIDGGPGALAALLADNGSDNGQRLTSASPDTDTDTDTDAGTNTDTAGAENHDETVAP
ncbi:MAG TPA: dihydroorotate dehydrogenase electron transfer subunit [Actinobacteria bacterium]|nr:dihydroorotate dehydrogenase electron transfer subunit [Actinomycetota bacterium]